MPRSIRIPPSLANIYKELGVGLGIARPDHGDLTRWAAQGVLLLNTSLTVEEGQEYRRCMESRQLATIFLAAPTSTDQRLKKIAEASRGFVYAVSRTGVTGEQKQLAGDARELVQRIRKYTKLPIAVGFGISTPEQFAEVGKFADAAVIGSAIVHTIEQNPGRAPQAVAELIAWLKNGSSKAANSPR